MMKNKGQSHRSRIAVARACGFATAALSFHSEFPAALTGLRKKSIANGCVRLIVASGMNCPLPTVLHRIDTDDDWTSN
ncbi:hypothetical protein Y032_0334g2826 [Ancylostoma ceylanicum]|uniref:Uncharacterized protein n=1 Tax=Ancylostoma ceylanicum TaxID=53326 RepID=A0A016RZG8_9BILA|nr:hypothetical protein Y032_0334g2826 [Ancylostoma ceylanicum]